MWKCPSLTRRAAVHPSKVGSCTQFQPRLAKTSELMELRVCGVSCVFCASQMELNIEYRARSDECGGAKRVAATGQRARNSNDGHTDSAFALLRPSSLLARYSIFICCATEAPAMPSINLPTQFHSSSPAAKIPGHCVGDWITSRPSS